MNETIVEICSGPTSMNTKLWDKISKQEVAIQFAKTDSERKKAQAKLDRLRARLTVTDWQTNPWRSIDRI